MIYTQGSADVKNLALLKFTVIVNFLAVSGFLNPSSSGKLLLR